MLIDIQRDEFIPPDICYHDYEMVIQTERTFRNASNKTIHVYGDHHTENHENSDRFKGIIRAALGRGAHAFIEIGAYQLSQIRLEEREENLQGLCYQIPHFLSQPPVYENICMNDIRSNVDSAPFISWANCYTSRQTATIVTWQDIENRFLAARVRVKGISTAEGQSLRNVTSDLFQALEDRWTVFKRLVVLTDNLLPGVVANQALRSDDVTVLQRLYEVGLLCDMENWITSSDASECLLFCGHFHAGNLRQSFVLLGFEQTSERIIT